MIPRLATPGKRTETFTTELKVMTAATKAGISKFEVHQAESGRKDYRQVVGHRSHESKMDAEAKDDCKE